MNTDIIAEIDDRKDNKKNFNIVWILYGVQYLFMFVAIYVLNKYFPELLVPTISKNSTWSFFFISTSLAMISILLIAWFEERLNIWVLFFGYFMMVAYAAILTNFFLKQYSTTVDLLPYLGVMLVPGILIILMGIIGYFKLIDIRKTWVLLTFFGVGALISFFVVYFAKVDLESLTPNKDYQKYMWSVPFFYVMIFFIKNIIDFYQIQKSLKFIHRNVKKEVLKITLYYGVNLFFRLTIFVARWMLKFFRKIFKIFFKIEEKKEEEEWR